MKWVVGTFLLMVMLMFLLEEKEIQPVTEEFTEAVPDRHRPARTQVQKISLPTPGRAPASIRAERPVVSLPEPYVEEKETKLEIIGQKTEVAEEKDEEEVPTFTYSRPSGNSGTSAKNNPASSSQGSSKGIHSYISNVGTPFVAPVSGGNAKKRTSPSDNGGGGGISSGTYFDDGTDSPGITSPVTKTYFQATELPYSFYPLESEYFGDVSYEMGQVNFLSADPTAMECADIIDGGAPRETLPLFTLESETPGVPYQKIIEDSDLDYGENFLVSFVRRVSDSLESSCHHQYLVLEDFEYFEEHPSHADSEFTGAFNPIAGTEDGLYSGLVSVFYEEAL